MDPSAKNSRMAGVGRRPASRSNNFSVRFMTAIASTPARFRCSETAVRVIPQWAKTRHRMPRMPLVFNDRIRFSPWQWHAGEHARCRRCCGRRRCLPPEWPHPGNIQDNHRPQPASLDSLASQRRVAECRGRSSIWMLDYGSEWPGYEFRVFSAHPTCRLNIHSFAIATLFRPPSLA